jgi:LmbE family N-acetylglucosaminyl deacetylase
MAKGTLLLSPHSDDMVMSACGILSKKILPEPVTLLTVFSSSNYIVRYERPRPDLSELLNLLPRPKEFILSLGRNAGRFGTANPRGIMEKLLDLDQTYKVTRIRLFEDIRFSASMGFNFRYLMIPDSKLRHGKPIMDPDWSLANERNIIDLILRVVDNLITRVGAQVIVAPWPYGSKQHVDHRIVSEIATQIEEHRRVRFLRVDDQPYSRRPFERMNDTRGWHYDPTVVRMSVKDMKVKIKSMGLYWSQMIPEYWRAVLQSDPGSQERNYSETLWQPALEEGTP